jgi:rubredoxin
LSIPWRCPACGIQIRHSDLEPEPRRNVRYRCHICRLELVFDERTGKLIVAPLDNDHD